MLRTAVVLLLSGSSLACGFAGMGLALYAHGPALAAAALFGLVGFAVGLACATLQMALVGQPSRQTAPLPAPELAALVRATLASAAQERAARPGSAADRQPAPLAADAGRSAFARTLAKTAADTPANTADNKPADTFVNTLANTPVNTPVNTPTNAGTGATAGTAGTAAGVPGAVTGRRPAPRAPTHSPSPAEQPRFASSAFGA